MCFFGDHIRVLSTPETEELNIAGLEGHVLQVKHPSFIDVGVIGESDSDLVVNVYLVSSGENLWFAPDLLVGSYQSKPWWKFWLWPKRKDLQRIEDQFEEVANEVQLLIDVEFEKIGSTPTPDSPYNQVGLKDGKQRIMDYAKHGEFGLALNQTLYMIEETDISISEGLRIQILAIASELDIQGIETILK